MSAVLFDVCESAAVNPPAEAWVSSTYRAPLFMLSRRLDGLTSKEGAESVNEKAGIPEDNKLIANKTDTPNTFNHETHRAISSSSSAPLVDFSLRCPPLSG
jgi:hypothetical protein